MLDNTSFLGFDNQRSPQRGSRGRAPGQGQGSEVRSEAPWSS